MIEEIQPNKSHNKNAKKQKKTRSLKYAKMLQVA